jgi:Flp pilus assembly protein TadD
MTEYARTLIADGNTERALDVLERAIAVDGSEGFAYLYLGDVYVHRGDLQRASGFLQQARRLLPPDPALRDELLWLDGLAAADPANSRGAER